jgi:hypothetical protein
MARLGRFLSHYESFRKESVQQVYELRTKSRQKQNVNIETPQSVRVAWKNKAMKIRPTPDVPASTYSMRACEITAAIIT